MKITPLLALALVLAASWPTGALAQKGRRQAATALAGTPAPNKLATFKLFVSNLKTTHLVFPQPVTYVDLGSTGIIAAKATGAENIVRVKAAGAGFGETNMTVLTAGGRLYTFVVNYRRNPPVLGLDLGAAAGGGPPARLPLTPLYVSDQKTSHLVFPFPVTYVDLGNPGIIASKATGADNIVRVKAAAAGFPEASMSVLTAGGRLYTFLVNYRRDPPALSIDLGAAAGGAGEATAATGGAILSDSPIPQGCLDAYAARALARGGTAASEGANQLRLRAGAVGYRQETLFFPLHVANRSNIPYDVDFVKFYIQDKQVAKRTAEQALEIAPVYVFNGASRKIAARGTLEQVYIFRKFTIPEQKQLIIELYEKGGGRNLKLRLDNADLLKARTFK